MTSQQKLLQLLEASKPLLELIRDGSKNKHIKTVMKNLEDAVLEAEQ